MTGKERACDCVIERFWEALAECAIVCSIHALRVVTRPRNMGVDDSTVLSFIVTEGIDPRSNDMVSFDQSRGY